MSAFVNSFSEILFACVCCIIVAVSVFNPFYGIPLITLFVCELLWQLYHKKTYPIVKFGKLHNCPTLVDNTAVMLLQEWPSPEGNLHYVRTASLYESSDKFPCHLVCFTPDNEVVAHACLLLSPNTDSKSNAKYVKMLQRGVPVAAVKNSAKLAGLETDFLDNPEVRHQTLDFTQHGPFEGYMTSLLVKPEYRGYGLGKAMCAFAVLVSKELEIDRLQGGCADKVLPFYEKMGICRQKALKRDDIPSVSLGNFMHLDLSNEVFEKAKFLMLKFEHWPRGTGVVQKRE